MHRDEHGRFPVSETRHPVAEPIVSQRLIDLGWKPHYPNNAPYAVLISHDIDFIYYKELQIGIRELMVSTFKDLVKTDLKSISGNFKRLNTAVEEKWPVETVLNYFQEKKIPTTYYFMCLGENDQDYNYDIHSLKPIVSSILKAGCEVGLHGGHTAYQDYGDFMTQLSRLVEVSGIKDVGYRNHYLKFNLESFDIMKSGGIKTDSTLGFAEMVGFRNGMAHPFRPYNYKEDDFFDFIEIPLMMMDQTFYKYMKLSGSDIKNVSNSIIDRVSAVSGIVSLLWHNTNFDNQKINDLEAMLNRMQGDGAWFCTPNQLVSWYNEQGLFSEQMELLKALK